MRVILEIIKGPQIGRTFECTAPGTFLIGRSPEAAFCLSEADPYVSRKHFQLELDRTKCILRDLNSTNATLINEKLVSVKEIDDGDVVQVGFTLIRININHKGVGKKTKCSQCGAEITQLSKNGLAELCDSCSNWRTRLN